MITSISNNIGISQVSLQYYNEENLTVLNGRFEVDPTSAAWIAAEQIELEFATLGLNKSCVSQVYMYNQDPGTQYIKCHRGTVLRSHIQGNKLIIEKCSHFDEYGPLVFIICSAYTAGGQRGQIVKTGYVTTAITNAPNKCTLDKKWLNVQDGYVFGMYAFKNFYAETGTLEQGFDITGMPADVDAVVAVVYADPYIDTKGSPIAEGHIQNGHFSCTNPDSTSFYGNSGTFIMFFAVRPTSSNDNNPDE